MKVGNKKFSKPGTASGFTLVELLVSIAILGVVGQGVILGYVQSTQRTEWNARSLAAQSIASQGAEQARSARWNAQVYPATYGLGGSDELGQCTNVQTATLDVAMSGQPVVATNIVTVTTVSVNPHIRQIRSDCVWRFMNRGLFTNTVILLRTSDQ
jgi:prepilin-type N-terminal cleavage/methylation domain-containing protein